MATESWDKNLPSASRFTILPKFNNEAVRDNNTGLCTGAVSRDPRHGFEERVRLLCQQNDRWCGRMATAIGDRVEECAGSVFARALRPTRYFYCSVGVLLDGDGIFYSSSGRVGGELCQQQCGNHH